ncbi:MAG: tetratricopeptide repeat protein [Christensenellales bacterium]
MAILDNIKVRNALTKHQKGDIQGAVRDYEALLAQGVFKPNYLLPYSVLLLREGGDENYQKVKNLLAKIQKSPELTKEDRSQLLMNFAVADWKLGNRDKAIALLEASHRERPCGLTYQTLGFLYVEAGDAEKALRFNLEALDYDDEDPVVLDNLGQYYYRVQGDKAAAKPYFVKAHQVKATQIDTLWFLSRYDLEAGDRQAALEKLEASLDGRFSPLNYVSKQDVEGEIARLKEGT